MRAILLLILLALAPPSVRGAFDVFLQATRNVSQTGTDIRGPSVDPVYAGWMQVYGFSAEGAHEGSFFNPSTPPTLGFRQIGVIKLADIATPVFFGQLTAGTKIDRLKMVIVSRALGRVEAWDVTCNNCYVASQEMILNDEQPFEDLRFAIGSIEMSYIQIDGNTGLPLVEIFGNWNLGDNSGRTGRRMPDFLANLDTDHDGLPDLWENYFHLNPMISDATLDSDGDGIDNLHEFLAGTDPTKADKRFAVTKVLRLSSGLYELTWQSTFGLVYSLESATSPAGPWTRVKLVDASPGGTTTTNAAGPNNFVFFRVTVLAPSG